MAEMLIVLIIAFVVLGIGAWVEQITRPRSEQRADDWMPAQLAFLRRLPRLRLHLSGSIASLLAAGFVNYSRRASDRIAGQLRSGLGSSWRNVLSRRVG